MMQDLPPEIIRDILLRLPLENIAACKCVCKPWLNVIETDDFVKSHLSKSAPALAVSMRGAHRFNVFKLEDEHDLVYEHEHDPITKFDFPRVTIIRGSVNGLLLLKDLSINHLYVCNPITREFIELREPRALPRGDCYGFGVGKISGQHKVVRLSPKSGCHVYTLEIGSSWRRVETTPLFGDWCSYDGAFVNGNIHWIVSNGVKNHIWCFDVETECFSTFSAPDDALDGNLYTLGDCLCFYDVEGLEDDNVIWLLKEYEQWLLKEYEQVDECWSMVDIILQEEAFHGIEDVANHFQPIKLYTNGNRLLLWEGKLFKYYCNKERTVREIGWFGKLQDDCDYIICITLTPSFLSLKRNLGMENVMSL